MGDRIASFLFDNAVVLMPATILASLLAITFIARLWPKRIWQRAGAVMLLLIFVSAGVVAGGLLYAERNIRSIIEHRVAVLTLHPVRGTTPARIADLRGRVVLVNFWATWCAPCRAELPDMNRLAGRFPAADVSILTITDEPRERIELFEQKVTPLRTIAATFDSDQPHGTLAAAAYQGRPTMIIIDAGGHIRDIYIGRQSYETLRRAIERQLHRRA